MADAAPKISQLGADLPKAVVGKKADDGKAKQVDADDQVKTDQPTAETDDAFQILNKDAAPQHAESKPQTEPGDGDKHGLASSRRRSHEQSSFRRERTWPGGQHRSLRYRESLGRHDGATSNSQHGDAFNCECRGASLCTYFAGRARSLSAVPLSGVAIEIAGKALAGKNRFEIRLDPPELGRIDVRLDVDRDGNVTSRLTVDRPDTLDLLRRDAAGLERALQDAGLKTANNGLQFSLRDQSMNEQQAGTSPGAAVLVATDESLPSIDVIPQRYRLAGQGGGLDIRV